MKKINIITFLLLLFIGFSQHIKAQTLLSESFNYAPGTLLTSTNWTQYAAGSPTIATSNGNLAYAGSIGTNIGNKISLTSSGQDVRRAFTSVTTSTGQSVYASMVVNVSAAQAAGDFFFALGTSASAQNARVYIRSNGSGFSFGVGKTANAAEYESTVRPFGTNIHLVLKYEGVTGTTNDIVKLYVNPSLATEPATPVVSTSPAIADVNSISVAYLFQGIATNAPTLELDGINIGTSWNSVANAIFDYGDAPVSYDTSNDGVFMPASHTRISGLSLGSISPDVELTPNNVTSGADNNGSNGDGTDEDTFITSSVQVRKGIPLTINLTVTKPTGTHYLYGWIDFNNDGKFQESELTSSILNITGTGSARTLIWDADQTATIPNGVTKLYMRIRLSDRQLLDFTTAAGGGATMDERSIGFGAASTSNPADHGTIPNGEVEDYQIEVINTFDYGDAPASFENDKDGNPLPALHAPLAGFSIGSLLDVETAPASVTAPEENNTTGDNALGIADEDGIATMASITPEEAYSISVPISIPSGLTGTKYVYGWLDLNGDGRFQLDEVATATTTATNTIANVTLTWSAAKTSTIINGTQNIYLRLRLSNRSLTDFTTAASGGATIDERSIGNGATAANNAANNPLVAFGEVEDYQLPVTSTIRYNEIIQGGISMVGNSWHTTGGVKPDIDSDASTTHSTSGDLILPVGSTIEKAFLAIEKNGFGNFTSVRLKVPGSTTYTTLDNTVSIANRTASTYAQMIWDITPLIPENGYSSNVVGGVEGRYFLANPMPVPSNMGGWSIIVVYKNPNSKFRQVVITDNWNMFTSNSVETKVKGVKVPSIGTVKAVVGVTGTYGDRGHLDYLNFGKIGGSLTALADPMTGVTNDALNSSIAWTAANNVSADGGPAVSGNYTARNPISTNHLYGAAESYEYDSDIFDATGVIAPSATPVDIVFEQRSAGSDILASGSYFISVDLATPPVLTKNLSPNTITDGGIATYTWTVTNTAADAVLQTVSFTDNLPSNIKVAATPNASVTGGTGGMITAVGGSGIVTISDLQLNPGESATITVDITNVAGQLNASCDVNPVAFTNSSENIEIPSGIALNASTIVPQCLIVTGEDSCPVTSVTASENQTAVCIGTAADPLTTAVVVTGSPVLTYQWYSNTTNSNSGGTAIVGAESDTYTPGTAVEGTMYYYVEVSATDCDNPVLSNTVEVTVINNPATCPQCTDSGITSVDLTQLFTGTTPNPNVVVEWWTTPTRDLDPLNPGVMVTDPTNVTVSGTYYAFFYDTENDCYNVDNSTAVVTVTILPACPADCTNPGATGTPDGYTKVGITVQQKQSAWPENIPNGFIALESKEKGFVITRVAHVGGTNGTPDLTNDSVKDPKEGMIVYDIADACVKLYNGTVWNCITSTCTQ